MSPQNMYKKNYFKDSFNFFGPNSFYFPYLGRLEIIYKFNEIFLKIISPIIQIISILVSGWIALKISNLIGGEPISLLTLFIFVVFYFILNPLVIFTFFRLLRLIVPRVFTEQQMTDATQQTATNIRNQVEESGSANVNLSEIQNQMKDKL